MKKIPVLEVFGPTIQGEGMVVGQKTMFVRTAGCDYSCSWCDSAFTWDGSAKDDIRQLTASEVWNELKEQGGTRFSHVTISGGNPALLANLGKLIDLLNEKNMKVAIETQGSKYQDWLTKIDDLTISPKPPSSRMTTDFEKLDFMIDTLIQAGRQGSLSLKVVVFDSVDLKFAKDVHKRYPNVAFYVQVGNEDIHESNDAKLIKVLLDKYEWLIDQVIEEDDMNDVRVLPQLHTLVWGNKRGV
ncbi:7-carboxy-7-deazaguanine synthase QueE [Metabacillus herbersteinensis]|uniref:7-carboxy-7-deazaguanine synthase n=1 Tax=Metabacillus herbersteinensis TaxID=283816 RepID=A0ABV6GA81_9BACI